MEGGNERAGDESRLGDDWQVSETAAVAAGLSNETRLRILLVLWDADDRPLRFSELKRRVGMHDPGQFRYHLRKLEERFVRNTPEGYDITMAGVYVVWAIRSGELEADPRVDAFETDSTCVSCGATLSLRYENELLSVTCPACGRTPGMMPFHPSGLVGRSPVEVLETYERVMRTQLQLGAHGICPRCYGAGSLDIAIDERVLPVELRANLSSAELAATTRFDPDHGEVGVVWTCSQCGQWIEFPLLDLLAARTDVARFYRDHGVEIDSAPPWERHRYLGEVTISVTEAAPLTLEVTVSLDDEGLTVSIEDGTPAIRVERVPAGDRSSKS